ncbi:hypothetical protein SAMN04489732_11737 [Amycolatopsis saalfeldensis]|uniref:Integrase core domain-containing protein n=1 Tax=Amycolatopsis saalfeldensis TaxID=394193 RepID=A0A1H8YHT2_9PSEU|nr:hypothetical protein SAMN04489732_11737 [Amycolatopsis saalfeldensis]
MLDKGIEHRYIKPRTPRLNGKVERSHRIDANLFNAELKEWQGRDCARRHRPKPRPCNQSPSAAQPVLTAMATHESRATFTPAVASVLRRVFAQPLRPRTRRRSARHDVM